MIQYRVVLREYNYPLFHLYDILDFDQFITGVCLFHNFTKTFWQFDPSPQVIVHVQKPVFLCGFVFGGYFFEGIGVEGFPTLWTIVFEFE